MKKPKGRLALVLLGLAILSVGGLLALPWLLSRPVVMEILRTDIEQRTGLSLSVEAWHIRILPSIGLELSQVQARHPGSPAPMFVADRLEMALQWSPLWEGRIVGKDLVIDRPRLTVRRTTNGTWSIDGRPDATSSSDSTASIAWLQAMRNVLVVDGAVTLIDDSRHSPRLPTHVLVTQATSASEMMGRHARVQISGEIPQEDSRAAFTWVGSLTQNPEGDRLQAEGDLRLRHLNLGHLVSSWMSRDQVSDGLAGSAQLTAHLRWAAGTEGSDLIADEWRAELADMSMRGTAAVTGLGTDHPHFSSTMSAQPVMLRRLLSQVPTAWVPAQVRAKLEEHGIDGLVSLESLSLSGRIEAGAHPTFSGTIGVRNGHVTVGSRYPSVEGLSASLSFDAAKIQLTDLRAQCGPLRLTGQEVVITQWLDDPHIDVRLAGAGSLTGLVEAARRIEEVPLLRDVFARMQDTTGDVEMVVHLAGQPAKGPGLSLLEADFSLHRVGFRSAVIRLLVEQVEGRIHASPGLVRIERLEGRVGPATLEARGDMTWTGAQVFSDVTLNMTAEASEVLSWLAEDADIGFRPGVEGRIHMRAAVTGTAEEPRLAGRIELTSAGLHMPEILTKPLHAPAAIEFDSRLSGGHRLVVPRLAVHFPPIKIIGDGTIDLSADMDFAANVMSGAISVDKLPKGVTFGLLRAGTLDAALHMEGRLKDRVSWRTSGEMRFDQGTIVVEALQEPIQEAFVTLRFDQDRIQIPRMAFHVGASDLRISGSIVNWTDTPKARLVVESSQIDVAAFSPSTRTTPRSMRNRAAVPAWWADGVFEAFVFADHVYYKKFLTTDFSSRVAWNHGLLTVERISGDTNDGHLAGLLKIRTAGRRVEQARSTFRASGIPVERVLSMVQDRPVLSGWLTASGTLQAEADRAGFSVGAVASRRPIQVVVEDGRIYHVPVISTLLSVMNLPALLQGQVDLEKDGLPLDRLKVVFSINNGVINAKEILLDSPILKVSGTGRYDIMADDFDMVLATSPLGSYSTMLKRIPLFGHLLSGDRQGFDTAVFELKGSANNPALRYLPTESLMTGVKGTAQLAFDILVNAITLPQKAFSMVEESIAGSEDEDF
jgi:hypothetical protein